MFELAQWVNDAAHELRVIVRQMQEISISTVPGRNPLCLQVELSREKTFMVCAVVPGRRKPACFSSNRDFPMCITCAA